MYNIHLLPAGFGDSILIEYGEDKPQYILIDGGPYHAYEEIIKDIKIVAPDLKEIELLVVTHIDIDHIDGIVVMLNQAELPFDIKEIWFNGINEIKKMDDTLGALQGEYLSILINKKGIPHNKSFHNGICFVPEPENQPIIILNGGMELRLLNPGTNGLKKLLPVWEKEVAEIGSEEDIMERLEDDHRYDEVPPDDLLGDLTIEQMQDIVIKGDTSEANGSSIAFIGTFEGKSCLFAGDAFTEYLSPAIDIILEETGKGRLKLDAWKLAHHGSKSSTLDELMQKIDCQHILVSTDGKRYKHPHKECIAKLLKHNGPGLSFYFNFLTDYSGFWNDSELAEDYDYTAIYPDKEAGGISINL